MSSSTEKEPMSGAWISAAEQAARRCRPLTRNELAWVELIRISSNDSDPVPTLKKVQLLRHIFSG